jgi:hypothetical protein
MKLPIRQLMIITKNALRFTDKGHIQKISRIVWPSWSDGATEILGRYCIIQGRALVINIGTYIKVIASMKNPGPSVCRGKRYLIR